ncbi:MAG: efflux RND transporter permease subunit [Myxococcales bacterium]|nr:efflux RND transporter permease subunit [Myxococcales bacterium]
MVARIIELCAARRLWVLVTVAALSAWAVWALRKTPLDAIPDLTDPQVIVYTEWMGRSPDLVEDQITFPTVRALQSTPNVRTVRGYSMFGMSFVYAIFEEGTDIYWARARVSEQLDRFRERLPPGVSPVLGPDATGIGWVYEYVLEDGAGKRDLAELRELQDFSVRPALLATPGVAEVASVGGFERQFQITIDPARLSAYGLMPADVMDAVRDSNSEVGARVLEVAGREYVVRGRGYVKTLEDLERAVVGLGPGGTPVRVADVARVRFGPEIRRGAADWNGRGETVGGIVVMRIGGNALDVVRALEACVRELSLPAGVRIVPVYDRSELIVGAIDTMRVTLLEEAVVVTLVCLLFLGSLRGALIAMIVLPLSALLAFIPMQRLGLSSNIMSLGGIAIAIGELADAAIVLVENAHVRLAAAPEGADRRRIVIDAAKEVGAPIFFSLLLITVSFLPIFTLAGQAGRLFQPLAFTKTFAMFAAALLSITLAPVLMVTLMPSSKPRGEDQHWLTRLLRRAYRPLARAVVRRRGWVLLGAAGAIAATAPVFLRLGSEFMPPLDEGSLLVMPTTFPGISIEEARRALVTQDRALGQLPEVASVFGKVGRADTATDPAQIDMIETVLELRPRAEWPKYSSPRWYSGWAPSPVARALAVVWPEVRQKTLAEVQADAVRVASTPGYQMSVAPPIRTRIDMLTTGVRTPVGVKILGSDLVEIEQVSLAIESALSSVRGTRSTFAERQTGREYVDVLPDRDAIARFGINVRQLNEVVEGAVGGMPVSTVIAGRSRFGINVRYAADFRADPEALRALLIPVAPAPPATEPSGEASGAGEAADGMAPTSAGAMSAAPPGDSALLDRWRPERPSVPLGELAEVRVVSGPPMIKNENGQLAGYVYVDVDTGARDLGGYVRDAKAAVAREVSVPPGNRLVWTGQYELMTQMEERLRYVLPLTLILVVGLLHASMRGWQQTALVLATLPFALAGSIWLLWARNYHLSTAVWVGLIAVAGVAAQTGMVMIVYLDEAFDALLASGKPLTTDLVDGALVAGATRPVRPLLMTVATTVLGLMPLLLETGVGADVSARTAAPVVGGLWSCMFLTLLVLPAGYAAWRHHSLRRRQGSPS